MSGSAAGVFFNNDRRFEQLAQKNVKNAFTYCVTTYRQSPFGAHQTSLTAHAGHAYYSIPFQARTRLWVREQARPLVLRWLASERKKIEYKQPARTHRTHPHARAHTHTHARSHARAHAHPVITAGPHLAPRPRTLVSP